LKRRDALPEDIRRFIRERIDSVELLDVLAVLRVEPSRQWAIDELSAELRSSPNSIGRRIVHLHRHRLIASADGRHRYRAAPATDAIVERLLAIYVERRTSVIDAIFSAPADPLQSFSDAFKMGDHDDDR
jgi:hypothetical protein